MLTIRVIIVSKYIILSVTNHKSTRILYIGIKEYIIVNWTRFKWVQTATASNTTTEEWLGCIYMYIVLTRENKKKLSKKKKIKNVLTVYMYIHLLIILSRRAEHTCIYIYVYFLTQSRRRPAPECQTQTGLTLKTYT